MPYSQMKIYRTTYFRYWAIAQSSTRQSGTNAHHFRGHPQFVHNYLSISPIAPQTSVVNATIPTEKECGR